MTRNFQEMAFPQLSSSPPLDPHRRSQARETFHRILNRYKTAPPRGQYNRPALLRLIYEYALSEEAKDNVLGAFFNAIGVSLDASLDEPPSFEETDNQLQSKLYGFADFLIDNFFLPLRASARRTPQSSPAYHLAVQRTQSDNHSHVGTSARLKTLRGDCLVRDHHRCVISRGFDQAQALKRLTENPTDARDDDNNPLVSGIDLLEVAHILPHSLKANNQLSLDDSRATALEILTMLDTDITHLIDGPEIDRPRNALTLTANLHSSFGNFDIYFEPVDNSPNTYRIDTFLPYMILNNVLPVTRSLFVTETIEPPLPRLLAVHRAIAHILHLSAADRYIDEILEERDEQYIKADGSTPLGQLVQLRWGGWWDGSHQRMR